MSCLELRPLKKRPYHRHTLKYFLEILGSLEKNIDKNLNLKKGGRDILIERNNIERVEKYNVWIEEETKELQCVWRIRKIVNKVLENFKCVTIGFYSSSGLRNEILQQEDEIIQYLSNINCNSLDYENIIQFEEVFKEVKELEEKFYKLKWAKHSEISKKRDELTPKIEWDTQIHGQSYETYKKFMDIAKSFLTDDEREKLDYYGVCVAMEQKSAIRNP